jgi:hypothetical protein
MILLNATISLAISGDAPAGQTPVYGVYGI